MKLTTLKPGPETIIAGKNALVFDGATARRHVVHARTVIAGQLVDAAVTAEPEEILELPVEPRTALDFALRHFSDLPAPEPTHLAERLSAPRAV